MYRENLNINSNTNVNKITENHSKKNSASSFNIKKTTIKIKKYLISKSKKVKSRRRREEKNGIKKAMINEKLKKLNSEKIGNVIGKLRRQQGLLRVKNSEKKPSTNSRSLLKKARGSGESQRRMMHYFYMSFFSTKREFLLSEFDQTIFKMILKKNQEFCGDLFENLYSRHVTPSGLNKATQETCYKVKPEDLKSLQKTFLEGRMRLDISVQLLLKILKYILTLKTEKKSDLKCLKLPEGKASLLLNKIQTVEQRILENPDMIELKDVEDILKINLQERFLSDGRTSVLSSLKTFMILNKEAEFQKVFNKFLILVRNPSHSNKLFLLLGRQIKANIDRYLRVCHQFYHLSNMGLAELEDQVSLLFDCQYFGEMVSFIQLREAADSILNKWFN